MKDRKDLVPILFWAMIAVFLVLMAGMFGIELFHGPVFLPIMGLFFLLSAFLVIAVLRQKRQEKSHKHRDWKRIFLLLTGFAAAGFVIAGVFHNLFYAAGILAQDITILRYAMEGLSVAFFLIAVIACPLGFIVGAIGTIVRMVKQRKKK